MIIINNLRVHLNCLQRHVKSLFSKILIATGILGLLAMSLKAQKAVDTSMVYIHQSSPSGKVRILKFAAKLFLPKNSIQKHLAKGHYESKAARIPKSLFAGFTIDTTHVNGRNVYMISAKGEETGKYVLYLHGGGYINNIFRQHWQFAAKIISETHCTFILPDYPLAPSDTYEEAFVMLDAIYCDLLSKTNAGNIILMGDSAGGGLALALAEKQKKEGVPVPGQIILLCPWLDITMSNPDIKEIEKKDVTLRVNSLVMAGKAWAGTTNTEYYLLSPINGSLEGLPHISVFIGTHDILIADCRKLKTLTDQKGIALNYFEYPGMFHDWMMLVSLKESKKAMSQITSLILNRNSAAH
jgi:acetyl esterase/lipase